MLSDIDQIELTNLLFKQVRLNRNNRFYGFVMNVCQIIMKALSHRKSKEYKFSDFFKDDSKMNQLFEGFILNFYRIEQRKYKTIKRKLISGSWTIPTVKVSVSTTNGNGYNFRE